MKEVLITGIFDFVNERYESNPKGLLPFRLPTAEEKALTLPPPARPDLSAPVRSLTVPPPAIEFFDDGLDGMEGITSAWEEFKMGHADIECERPSNTEFLVTHLHFLANGRFHSQNLFSFSR